MLLEKPYAALCGNLGICWAERTLGTAVYTRTLPQQNTQHADVGERLK